MEYIEIREERATDARAVREVNEAAFGQWGEAALVEALHQAGAVALSLVAEDLAAEYRANDTTEGSGAVVRHILFSPVVIDASPERTSAITDGRIVGLAPMAVRPDRQRQGIGSALVRRGIEMLREAGWHGVVVLGHPAYYPRFGFIPAGRFGLRYEHPCPDDAFMALELVTGAFQGHAGIVRFHDAFRVVE